MIVYGSFQRLKFPENNFLIQVGQESPKNSLTKILPEHPGAGGQNLKHSQGLKVLNQLEAKNLKNSWLPEPN